MKHTSPDSINTTPSVEMQTIQDFMAPVPENVYEDGPYILKDPYGFGNKQYIVLVGAEYLKFGRLIEADRVADPSIIKIGSESIMTAGQLIDSLNIAIPRWWSSFRYVPPRGIPIGMVQEIHEPDERCAISENGSYLAYLLKIGGIYMIRFFIFDPRINLRNRPPFQTKILLSGSYVDLVLGQS